MPKIDENLVIDLLEDAAIELAEIYDHQYSFRDKYPVLQRKYDRDMYLVNLIRKFLEENRHVS